MATPADTGAYRFTLGCAAATCALTPAYNIRWHVGLYPTTLLEVAILLTIAAFLFEAWLGHRAMALRTPFTMPGLLFLAAGALSVGIASDHRAALGLFRAYLVEPFALFFVVGEVARTWRRASLILLGLGVAGAVVAVPNAVVVLNVIRQHTLNVAVAPPVVIYTTANALALFLVPLIAVAASIVVHARDRGDRIASGVFLLIALPATLLTFSRGGYLALLAIAIGLALTHRHRPILLLATVVAAVAVSRIPAVASRIGHEVDLNDPNNSLVQRFRLWGATLRMLRDHPVFGGGLSGFKHAVAPYRTATSAAEDVIYPHNIFLNSWTETGLFGVFAFAWLLVQAVRVSVEGWRHAQGVWRPLCLGVLLAMIGVVVHGLVDVPYWKNDLSVEFWVLLALTWAGLRHRPEVRARG